ncbi:formyltransferase family protein [Afipia birgiae]|jgi:methionyl-tRNA formyltransferase|uniref:formyltransferase family protein n=1 Tax=Afipia birgiae TaxID=151414 RepID=UPI00036DB317|nr:formyltransferase family protein [Afipia birgiae]
MKIALLTTQTPHHAFFVREIVARFEDVHVFAENSSLKAPFETFHHYETERDSFEREFWFKGANPQLDVFAPVTAFDTMNGIDAIRALADWRADIAIVFGTGRLSEAVLKNGPQCFLNLHGGDPEDYRGLDTHLWAIYHGDFDGLVTTLHTLNPMIDDGDICLQEDVHLSAGMPLYALRRANTETCIRLTLAALAAFRDQGAVPSRKQRRKGRYYSFMPSPLKDICRRKFDNYTKALVNDAEGEHPDE